jgi:hypothetical protein
VRALRDLPAAVPDVPGARPGDGFAARPALSHPRRRRRARRAERHLRPPPRPLPGLPRVRDRVPVGRAVRIAPRSHARPASAPAAARLGAGAPGLPRVSRAAAAGRAAGAAPVVSALRASRPGPPLGRAAAVSGARGHGRPAARRARRGAAARARRRPRTVARPGRPARRLRPAPSPSRGQPRHRAPAVAGRVGRGHPASAGLLRRPRSPRGPARRAAPAFRPTSTGSSPAPPAAARP